MSWKTAKLGDICKIVNGSTPARSNKKYWTNGTIPWFTIDDFREQGHNIEDTNQKITKLALSETSSKLIPKNTILLCCTASVGVTAIARVEMATNQQFNGLIPNPKELMPEFLYYLSTTLTQKLLSISGSATLNFVAISKLKEIKITYPPISEQQRIVTKLDLVFTEIDKEIHFNKKKLLQINLFNQALLKSEFNIESKKTQLSNVVDYDKKNSQGSNLPYVGMENISRETMKIVGKIDIPKKTSSTFMFNSSHVLFGRLRPYLKKILLPDFIGQCSTEIFCLKPNERVNKKFLAYWLLSPIISYQINNSSTGARMPRANMSELLNYQFPIPSLLIQEQITKRIDKAFNSTDEIKLIIEKKLSNYKSLKSSILMEEIIKIAA